MEDNAKTALTNLLLADDIVVVQPRCDFGRLPDPERDVDCVLHTLPLHDKQRLVVDRRAAQRRDEHLKLAHHPRSRVTVVGFVRIDNFMYSKKSTQDFLK